MVLRGGKKETFDQTEDIQWKLGNTIITIEGIGKQDEQIVHHAFAIISYDPENMNYNFRSYTANGRGGDFEAELKDDNTFVWHISVPRREIRYTIQIKDNNTWYEIGEIKRGEDWVQFFEMTLNRIN